jgi:D-alanyl-D-alanine carboxypeptidase
MSTTDDPDDSGWYPKGWTNPADDPALDWIVPATDDDPVPPEDRLAEEPETVEVEGDPNEHLARELRTDGEAGLDFQETEARRFVPSAVSGINLQDYSRSAQSKGWGGPCTAARATVRLTEAAVTVDARLAELVGLIMRECERRGYRFRRADTGAYNCRYISGTTTWSNHAWAIAVDVNWQSNPFTSTLQTDIPVWMRHLFNRYGFAWGGDYSGRKDAMHFEFMGTPQQAATALTLARKEISGQTTTTEEDMTPQERALLIEAVVRIRHTETIVGEMAVREQRDDAKIHAEIAALQAELESKA